MIEQRTIGRIAMTIVNNKTMPIRKSEEEKSEGRVREYVKHQRKEESGQLKAVWDKGATGKA